MINLEIKRIRQAEFTKQHTLSKEQFEELIKAKMERARLYHAADKKQREVTASCR